MSDDATPYPWDALADAHQRREDARRAVELAGGGFDLALAEHELAAAEDEYERAADVMASVGGLLILFAIDRGGLNTQRILQRLFDTKTIWRKALQAEKAAVDAQRELDAVRVRLAELERRLDDLTPGVGEPGVGLRRVI